jgi:hypothetical protein
VKINAACGNLFGRFQSLSRLAMSLISLLLPALAAGQATFVQVNSNTATVYTNSVAVSFAS